VYILTDTIYTCLPTRQYQDLYLAKATDHNLPLLHLILTCSTDANVERITDSRRHILKDREEACALENRMTYEIAHFVKPGRVGRGGAKGLDAVEGLVGEYEVETTQMGVAQTAGVLAEYVQDALRGAGWYFQIKRSIVVRPRKV